MTERESTLFRLERIVIITHFDMKNDPEMGGVGSLHTFFFKKKKKKEIEPHGQRYLSNHIGGVQPRQVGKGASLERGAAGSFSVAIFRTGP